LRPLGKNCGAPEGAQPVAMSVTFVSLPAALPRDGTSLIVPVTHHAPNSIWKGTWSTTGSVTALIAAGTSVVLANTRKHARKTQLAAMPGQENLPAALQGTGGPRPYDFFDPAGLTKGKTEEQLLQLRAQELKHGRTAMLACLGWFHTAAGVHYIGDAAARTVVSDNPLINAQQLPLAGWLQILFTLMLFEWMFNYVVKPPRERPWDLLGWTPVIGDEEYPPWKETQLKELNNGRLAMVGIIGLIAQDLYTGEYFAGINKYAFGSDLGKENILGFKDFTLFGFLEGKYLDNGILTFTVPPLG